MNKHGKTLKNGHGGRKPHIREATRDFLDEGHHFASKIYEGGLEKLDEAQKNMQILTDEFVDKIKEKPVSSVLIAAGVGFILSKLFSK